MSTLVLLWKHAQPYGLSARAGETLPSMARNDSRPAHNAMVFANGGVMGYLPSEGLPRLPPYGLHVLVDVIYPTQPTMCENCDFRCRNALRIDSVQSEFLKYRPDRSRGNSKGEQSLWRSLCAWPPLSFALRSFSRSGRWRASRFPPTAISITGAKGASQAAAPVWSARARPSRSPASRVKGVTIRSAPIWRPVRRRGPRSGWRV